MKEIIVNLKKAANNSYPIFIRAGLLDDSAALVAERFPGAAFAVISDSNVTPLYAVPLLAKLQALGCRVAELISFPAGEESKTREVKAWVEDRMLISGLGRDTVVVAAGGGVVGDLAGFVAATYARGIRLVQVPTSLLAMVDSSIGGKTGVDVPWGKNLIGAFHQPALVIIDPRVLVTLEHRQFVAGMAEAVKHGVIRDAQFFEFLEENPERLVSGNEQALTELIAWNCRIKAKVVEEDEREGNLRQILNFGHTVAHALETLAGYRRLHGEAVACGMAVEADIAVRMGLFPAEEALRLEKLLCRLGLAVDLGSWKIRAEEILRLTGLDKKARQGLPRYVLPVHIGEMARGGEGGLFGIPVNNDVALAALFSHGALN